jgi:SAM-dependent MidA family methyltransferase
VLGNQCAAVLRQVRDGNILELGAGSGTLAVTILNRLEALQALPDHYFILEVSADFKERQEARLREEVPGMADRVVWLSDLPTDFRGAIIANEVADALPVERFVKKDGRILQSRVANSKDGFSWRHVAAPDKLQRAIENIEQQIDQPLANNYQSEISLGLEGWIDDLRGCMQVGFIFIFDYGVSRREYYAADRQRGWLRCHFRHRVHDNPLVLPGIQDLTAWVDFSSVADAGCNAGLDVAGYVSQAHFLMAGGLEQELAGMAGLPALQQLKLSREVKLLTLPTEMGENFKCMGLGLGDVTTPPAFSLSDRRHAL